MNGIELIAQERKEQIEKHGRTIENDIKFNSQGHLKEAANLLLQNPSNFMDIERELLCPEGWNEQIWMKMWSKPYKERLIIAGALIAAELDRIINLENES